MSPIKEAVRRCPQNTIDDELIRLMWPGAACGQPRGRQTCEGGADA